MKNKFTQAVEGTGLGISGKNDAPKIGAGSAGISSSSFPEIILKV